MCELIVNTWAEPATPPSRPRRGDVIDVFPDNHQFGAGERGQAHWRVLALPGVDAEDVANLLAHETPEDAIDHETPEMLQYRMHFLDLDTSGLPDFLVGFLSDQRPRQNKFVLTMDRLKSMTKRRTETEV
jgi:hypothetical protein